MEEQKSVQKRFYPARLDPEDPRKITLVPISEEQFHALLPPIWKHQRQMKALGMCTCTRQSTWKCDADCELCEFKTVGHVTSLDERYEEADNERTGSQNDPADIVSKRLLAQQVLIRIRELCPEAVTIGELIQKGLSQREAIQQLGLKRSTFQSRLKKIEEIISEEVDIDDIKKIF